MEERFKIPSFVVKRCVLAISTRKKVKKEYSGQESTHRIVHLIFVIISNFAFESLGGVILLLSLSIAVWARIILGRKWSGAIQKVKNPRLIRNGPYKHIRHPIYTGILCGICGTFFIFGIVGSLVGFIIILISYIAKIKIEENFLVTEVRFYIWVIRGTPLLVQLFTIHFAIPSVFPVLTMPPFVSACIALSLNAAAYIAEIARGAIQSIDKGQMEAARSLGLSYGQAMRRVIIPQAFRRMLPPLGNEFIALIKESSLVSTIALYDLLRTGQQIISSTYRYMEIFLLVGLIYLVLTTIMTFIVGKVEKKVGAYE